MTPLERRGRIIFLILAAIICLDQVAGATLTIVMAEGPIDWWKVSMRLFLPIVLFFCWGGDKQLKWLAVGTFTLRAFTMLAPAALVIYKVVERTPWDQARVMVELLAIMVGPLLAFGSFYAILALAFAFLPSLQAFWRFQREGPEIAVEILEAKDVASDA